VNLRRGFWRLTLVFWLLVVVAIVASLGLLTSPSPLLPFQRIGADGSLRPDVPAECLAEPPEAEEPGLSLGRAWERLERFGCDAKRTRLEAWEAAALPAFRTKAYWTGVRNTALAIAGASALIWGLFHLAAWVAAGFRAER
jgi:hypothetical protein